MTYPQDYRQYLDDPELELVVSDRSLLPQTQNIQEHYRIVAQVWSAGEGQ